MAVSREPTVQENGLGGVRIRTPDQTQSLQGTFQCDPHLFYLPWPYWPAAHRAAVRYPADVDRVVMRAVMSVVIRQPVMRVVAVWAGF